MSYLRNIVKAKIVEIGDDAAADFFGVSKLLIQQWRNGSKVPSIAAVEKVFEVKEAKPIERANWEGKKVVLLQPFYKAVHPVTHFSILGLLERDKMGALMRHNDAFIHHARNVLADQFLETGVEWSFWTDDDMVFPFGNAGWFNHFTGFNLPEKYAGKHTLNALLSHNKSIVGATYFGRNPAGRAMFYEAMLSTPESIAENARVHNGPIDELKPVKWCATGALLVHRQVYLDLRKTFPNLAPAHPTESWHYFSNANDAAVNKINGLSEQVTGAYQRVRDGKMDLSEVERLFDDIRTQLEETKMETVKNSRLQQGEDQTFGIRAGIAGHQSYVDLSVHCGHIGFACYGAHNTRGR